MCFASFSSDFKPSQNILFDQLKRNVGINTRTNDVRIFEIEIQNSSPYNEGNAFRLSLIHAISSQLRTNIIEMTVPSPQ